MSVHLTLVIATASHSPGLASTLSRWSDWGDTLSRVGQSWDRAVPICSVCPKDEDCASDLELRTKIVAGAILCCPRRTVELDCWTLLRDDIDAHVSNWDQFDYCVLCPLSSHGSTYHALSEVGYHTVPFAFDISTTHSGLAIACKGRY